MSNQVMTINNHQIQIREYRGQRVVTLRDVDELHERPDGTASRNFSNNKNHFIEGEDFFYLTNAEIEYTQIVNYSSPKGLVLLTESGYLMLVKSFSDDLAWTVQRQLVNGYFRAKESNPITQTEALLQAVQILALQEKEIKALQTEQKALTEAQEAQTRTIQSIKDALTPTDKAWRKWVSEQLNRVVWVTGQKHDDVRNESYQLLEKRAACNLIIRLKNLKERMFLAAYTKTQINNANRMDVIESDPRLKEIYSGIIRELIIKYVA